jgi:hypothetical protein
MARSACCDLRTDTYMTSIVLFGYKAQIKSKGFKTHSRMVLLYLNGLNTRRRRNIRNIENRNKTDYNPVNNGMKEEQMGIEHTVSC